MARIDHARANAAERMRRQGTDCIADYGIPAGLQPPKRRPSKAALRAEIEAATVAITRMIRCRGCGHSAAVALPPARIGASLRCSRCGEVAEAGKKERRLEGRRTEYQSERREAQNAGKKS